MDQSSNRLGLPFIIAGQAQKEVIHNEALVALDFLVQPVVVESGLNAPPTSRSLGQCWLIGTAPTGDWINQPQRLACWTSGGWRFVAPFAGMECWSLADTLPIRFDGLAWIKGDIYANRVLVGGNKVVGVRQPAISAPSGGTNVDSEARLALGSILAALRSHGLIST